MPSESDDRLANLLAATATGLSDAMTDAFVGEGFDATAATALVALLDFSPSGTVQRLSRGLGLTHSGTVRLIDRLTVHGLVERRAGRDLRSVTVALTRDGRRLAQRLRKRRRAAVATALAELTDEARDHLTAACETMLAALVRQRLAQRETGAPPAGGALCRLCDFAACGRPAGRCPADRTATTLWADVGTTALEPGRH
jgi:DNA-binding MarR family transcriptional regulator